MDNCFKWLLLFGSISGFLAVMFGAFGGHLLKRRLTEEALFTYDIAVRYQIYHTFAIFAAAWIATLFPSPWPLAAGAFFILGIGVFSGSLYAMTLSGIRLFAAFTPIGGVFFLIGWLCLATAIVRAMMNG